ncbi:MAG: NUDIX hydrolase [candidate division SR1 bacterium]|nr:MAG: NUDIX hydrolase [candidate division SR1 bacterium]
MPLSDQLSLLEKQVNDYLFLFPGEKEHLSHLKRQITIQDNLRTRKNFNGHLTASAYVLKGEELLMIHNINLNKWLAPGGHWEEGDNELWNTAKRELREETGVIECDFVERHKKHQMIPIDIDTHPIPDNPKKQEPSHFHHDFRYVFSLDHQQEIALQLEEVSQGERKKLSELTGDVGFERVKAKILKYILTV